MEQLKQVFQYASTTMTEVDEGEAHVPITVFDYDVWQKTPLSQRQYAFKRGHILIHNAPLTSYSIQDPNEVALALGDKLDERFTIHGVFHATYHI